jgi:phosphomannomutase
MGPARGGVVGGTRIASVSGLRGVIGDGLDPVAVVEFAAAYATGCGPGPILIGHDGRTSALMLQNAVVAGVTATGRAAVVGGPLATPTLGFLVRDRGYAGGIQISASHNPPQYNGLKFFQVEGMVLGPEAGRALLERIERKAFGWVGADDLGGVFEPGGEPLDRGHQQAVEALVKPRLIRQRGLKVVLDACHGAGGQLGPKLLRSLGCPLIVLGERPDGRYDHPPEPTEANLQATAAIVPAVGADLGFAQDPDADRLAIIDEQGRYIGEELTLALAARRVLELRKGPVVLNLSTSRVAEEIARGLGCPVHRTPVGEIHVVERMKAVGAVLGGEGNGGVIDPRVGFVRDSFVAMALVLDLLAESGQPLSKHVDDLPKFAMVKEKYPTGTTPVATILERIRAAHPDAQADRSDGLRLDWHDCWAHVRPSNTEPIVRVIAEAADAARAQELASFLGRWVRDELGGPTHADRDPDQ